MRTTASGSGSNEERRDGAANGGTTSGLRAPPTAVNAPFYANPRATLHEILHPNPIVLFSLAFFLLGLLNNALYVVVLTSAQALLPKGVPVGLVALANIGPALVAKAIWPYLLKGRVRYARRVISCTALSTAGMLVIAFIPALETRLLGISMASFSSGLGELTYLQLCTRYGPMRAGRGVGWFASGTGAAGLFGAASWWVVRPLGVKGGLTIMSLVPLLMAAAYFVVMPDVEAMKEFEAGLTSAHGGGYQAVPSADDEDSDEEDEALTGEEQARGTTSTAADAVGSKTIKLSFQEKMDLLKPMLVPFIAPLVLVYLFEYTINQGIAPTLIYSVPDPSQHLLLSWLIKNLHDYYVLYQTTYQAFVFLSRSSLSVLHIPPIPRSLLWLPALVQASILALLTSESLFAWFRESIARSLVIVFVGIEGIAGGWAYVSVFYQIGTTHHQSKTISTDSSSSPEEVEIELARRGQEQEFRVGCVGVGDSMGILLASIISMPLQLGLCDAQVKAGRELCAQL
ncbi:batten's disease protein Cln3 [Microstroma glucosiphilum]|uniref:Protein BTN n=1 Tax=Pseudomicrostroma glucosiphilum TaxID=1684307 RepID=A0A316UDB4_9BASI|nr:batten's disease protein Cln3 [Pseudomicrostroma glucosiphilum]PWN22834.1 batten's disease protein Cln3 [Pseudomicrostroma glucosiphilum]